ncbi:MAG: hypothetical protein WBL66_07925, partial [Candidatus Acidiferrales bacterium]
MLPDAPEFYIFTATDNRFGIDGGAKLLAKSEGFAQQGGEAIEAALLRQQFCGAGGLARRGVAGDLSFDDGEIDAADAGRFASAENITHGGLLRVIDANKAGTKFAAEERGQFGIGHEMKS